MNTSRKPIDDTFLNRLKDVTDIVAVIGNSVNLKQSGTGRYTGLCPFHDEKTPSFSVNATQGFYHCFGCGVSGDAIKFITEQEGVDFYEAIHRLAQMQGMQVEYSTSAHSDKNQAKEEDYKLVELANNFYHEQLLKNAPALKYFEERFITAELIQEYHLGYAPPGYDNLLKQLGEDDGPNSKRARALQLGLIKKNEQGKIYDAFRDRVIFPILDMRRRPIGFGGRIISSNNQEAKYINSSESPIFHKQFNVFGLPQALQSKVSKHLVVVEGYMDALALAGIDRAVASLGTAFSSQHAKILWGRSDKLVLAFDGDDAGQKASARAVRECLAVLTDDKELAVKFMPQGQDPYDVVNGGVVNADAADGDVANGDVASSDAANAANGDAANAEVTNGDAANAEVTNGNAANAEVTNGNAANAEVTNGNAANGDVANADAASKLENKQKAWQAIPEIILEDYLLQPFTGSMDPQAQRLAIADFVSLVSLLPPDSMRAKLLVKKLEDILGVKIPISTPATQGQGQGQNRESGYTKNDYASSKKSSYQNSYNNNYKNNYKSNYKNKNDKYPQQTPATNSARSQQQISPEQKLILQLMFAPTQSAKLLSKWQDRLQEASALDSGGMAARALEIIKIARLGSASLYGYAGGSDLSFVIGGDSLDGLRKGAPDACIERILGDVYEEEMKQAINNQNKELHAKMGEYIRQLRTS